MATITALFLLIPIIFIQYTVQDLIPDCTGKNIDVFSCCFKDQDITTVTYCLLDRFECKANPGQLIPTPSCQDFNISPENETFCQFESKSDDLKHLKSWNCYSQEFNFRTLKLVPAELTSSATFEATTDSLEVKIQMSDGYPIPYSRIEFNESIIEPSTITADNDGLSLTETYILSAGNSEMIYRHTLWIYQPGYLPIESIDFQVKFGEKSANGTNQLAIILGILIPLCLLISAAVSVFCCYKRKLLCFQQPKPVQNNQLTSRSVNNEYSTPVNSQAGITNSNFVDESNFTDVDLNDGNVINNSPMSNYIASTLAARYSKSGLNDGVKLYPIGLEMTTDDFVEDEATMTVGRCRSLEAFETSRHLDTPGLLSVQKGEELVIIQKDLGSGWTCVQNQYGSSGFVPTSLLYFFD
jgi:hypothetical protein